MRIGYARVSTDEQSLDLQLDALKEARCQRIFTGTTSLRFARTRGTRARKPRERSCGG